MIRRRMTVKRVDPWSVLKLGLVVNIAGAAILLITGMVVWSVIRRLQLIERVCEQAQSLLGFESCTINGVEIMRSGLLLAGLLVVVATGVMVFMAFLYNLIADLTGGIEVSVLDHSGRPARAASSSGGVQVAPELQTSPGRGRTGAPLRSGPVMASPGDDTMSSAAARPQAPGAPGPSPTSPPPDARSDAPSDAPPAARPPTAVPSGDESGRQPPDEDAAAAASRPGMFQRAAAAGAAVRDVADRTGAALSEAGRRAGTTLADVTEDEAAARARRSDASHRPLDDLATDPLTDTGEMPAGERPPGGRGDEGRGGDNGRPSRSSRGGSSRGGSDRGDRERSPQEAAAARARAGDDGSSEELPPRDSSGRFMSRAEIEEQSAREQREQQDALFGQHPGRADDG